MHISQILHKIVALGVLLAACPVLALAPTITGVTGGSEQRAVINGKGFGVACAECEVRVQYAPTLLYAVPVLAWTPTEIAVDTPDLNQNAAILRYQVKARTGLSNLWPGELQRTIQLMQRVTRSHALNVGDKGEDRFEIEPVTLQCGETATVFDHAEVVIGKHRFADARIVAMPPSGCARCTPIVVRWYVEPTGFLNYAIEVYGRKVEGVCPERLRTNEQG